MSVEALAQPGDERPDLCQEDSSPGLTLETARVLTARIRDTAVRALDAIAEVQEAINLAYSHRAWAAMGYGSWDAYCAAEFSETRLWTSVEDRHERTVALRNAGLSQRAIAAVLGVDHRTVGRDLEATASSTGADSPVDDGSVELAGIDGRVRPSSRPSSAQVLERQVQVVHLRGEGLTQTQIADRLGVSQATVSADETTMTSTLALAGPAAEEAVELAVSDADMDVTTLAEVLGVELAVSTTPQAHLEVSGKAAARDLASAVGYLRDQVVFTDAWVRYPKTAARVSSLLTVPVAEAVAAGAAVLGRLDMSEVTGPDRVRAIEAVSRARTVLAGVVVPGPDTPMPRL
ncbi:MAG TPA: hypothetical protein VGC67_11830 [Cellulomonas sp.]